MVQGRSCSSVIFLERPSFERTWREYRIHRFVDGCGQEKLILDVITNKEHVSKIKEMVIDDSKNI